MSTQGPVKPLGNRLAGTEFAAWGGFLRVHATLARALDAELQAAHRLPLTDFEVLLWLANSPEQRLRLSELASSVLLSLSGVSRLVTRLAQQGLVRREPCPEDRRGAYVVLTDAGLSRMREARATHVAGIRARFLRHFSAPDLEVLASFWARLLPEEPVPEPTPAERGVGVPIGTDSEPHEGKEIDHGDIAACDQG